MNVRHEFIKCKSCTKTKRRSTTVQPGWKCTMCASGGKRSRRKKAKS